MKNSVRVLLFAGLLSGCVQKEMKVARSNERIITELTDQSPIYITNEKDEARLNENNRIGNTHWVLSVDRSLTLKQILPHLKKIIAKKYAKGDMHEDTKGIYFIYSDTLHKHNAYVKMPFTGIENILHQRPEHSEDMTVINITSETNIKNELKKTPDQKKYVLYFSEMISVEQFINVLIELEKENKTALLFSTVYINGKPSF